MSQTSNFTNHTHQVGQVYAPSMTVGEISNRLTQQAETVAKYLLPNGKRNGSCWVAGSIHGDEGKSLRVVLSGEKTGRWMDHADDSHHGDLLDLWADTKGLSTAEAIREAKDYLGIHDAVKASPAPQRRNVEKKAVVPETQAGVTALKADGDVYRYLVEERKLQPEVLKRFKMAEMNGNVIVFPYLAPDGSRVMIKYLPLERKEGKHPWTSKDSAKTLFGWQTLPENCKTVVITEGEIDAMTLAGFGIPALSIPFGAGKQSQVEWIENDLGRLEQFEKIIVWMDDDEAGRATAPVIVQRLGIERCRLALASHGCNDPNEMLQKGCEEADFRECMEAAELATQVKIESNPCSNWPALVPLDSATAPPLDGTLLPGWAGEYARALSVATETPVELAVGMVLAACSTAAARRVTVMVKPGYFEQLCIWILAALVSGSRKSAVQNAATAPLLQWEFEQGEALEPEIKRMASERKTKEARARELRNKSAKQEDAKKAQDLAEAAAEIEANLPDVPIMPQIWTSDATPERLGTLLAEHEECMGWLSSEGGLFEMLQGRYSRGIPNLDLVLKAHSGDAERVDRGSRPPVYLRRPCLTIGLSPQPETLRGLAKQPGFRGRGLLARFLYLLPVSPLGYRSLDTPPVPDSLTVVYSRGIQAMLNWEPALDDRGCSRPHLLHLSTEAFSEWCEFAHAVEKQMRPSGSMEHVTDWAGKAPGAAARMAGILHCIEHAHGRPWENKITEKTMTAALEIMAVISQHSLSAFDLMGADPTVEAARHVWAWIERRRLSVFTVREAFNALKGTYPRVREMVVALDVLEERGYIEIMEPERRDGPGRPSSLAVLVRPEITRKWQ